MTSIDLSGLGPGFGGALLTSADGAPYDAARRVFNAMYDRRPLAILRPRTARDVAMAVNLARTQGVPLAVKGGGHSVAGYSSIDDGLLIDLAEMKRISVEPGERRARVEPGANWGEVDRETQAHGLATTGGRVTDTGVAGFTLGSGSGWLERLHGWSCDNLLAAEVVTADGRTLRASASENVDLFWGLKGGGGNFGIVTEFEFRLHPVGPMVLAGLVLHARDKAPEVLRFYREFMARAPREVGGGVVLLTAPAAPFIPPELQGRPVVAIVAVYFGSLDRGMDVLAPLRAFGSPPVDLVQPMPYVAFQALLDGGNPWGRRNYWRSDTFAALPDEAIDTFIACAATATSPLSVLVLAPTGGAIADVPDAATPLRGRTAPWLYHCYGVWTDSDDERHIRWVRATEQALRPWSEGGIALNFVSEPNQERIRRAFGPEKYARLVALKQKYDPENLFRMNQNITPHVGNPDLGAVESP